MPIVGLLLGFGADVDLPRLDGRSPLLLACAAKQEAAAVLLLEHGADADAFDAHNLTGRAVAMRGGLAAVLAAMPPHGAAGEADSVWQPYDCDGDERDPNHPRHLGYVLHSDQYGNQARDELGTPIVRRGGRTVEASERLDMFGWLGGRR